MTPSAALASMLMSGCDCYLSSFFTKAITVVVELEVYIAGMAVYASYLFESRHCCDHLELYAD